MDDCLGRDEGKRDDTAEEIVPRADAEGAGLIGEQRISRHEIQCTGITRRRIVVAAKMKALERGDRPRNGPMRCALMI